MNEAPVITIVGRPNVGKSTLFNRLIGRRRAIVHKSSGITRDRIEDDFEWGGKRYHLIDLAGIDKPEECPIKTEAMIQVDIGIEKADAILCLVDAADGLTSADKEIAELIRKCGKPVILVANKCDHKHSMDNIAEFYALGLGEPIPVSALHSYNINELLDTLEDVCEGVEAQPVDTRQLIRLVIIGKQNVGKSTLLNAILGEYRAIVSDIPGTTRDAIDAEVTVGGEDFILMDTAGMKKKSKKLTDVDYYSVRRAQESLHSADVVLFMLDVQDGITSTDANIAGLVQASRKAYVILANKWDLTEADSEMHRKAFEKHVEIKLHFLQDAPVVFTSGLDETGLESIFNWAKKAYENWNRRLPTGELNASLNSYIAEKPPPAYRGHRLKFFFATQPKVAPPTIVTFVNAPSSVRQSYVRYLQKRLRADYEFTGTPVEMYFRKRKRK